MSSNASKRILISPLDWGLGHSSRCLPLIGYLHAQGHKVAVAGNEWQRQYVKKNFPAIETLHLDGYDINYSKRGSGFMFSMFRQMPKLLAAIRKENDWLVEQAAKQGFDGIISDNRYGLFHKRIPSVIMTHQLSVRTSLGKVPDEMLRRIHYKYLERFNKCWVVDVPGKENLGGKLSHPKTLPANAEYIGLLSQFEVSKSANEGHLLILLSGPEPQRMMLSQKLWEQAQQYTGKVVFVEGTNKVAIPSKVPVNIKWHGKISTRELQPLLDNAKMVICRSGYSTLMDLVAMGKQAIIIPTPGQTEQAYLAKHLHKEGVFFSTLQKNFDLQMTLDNASLFPFKQLQLQDSFTVHKAVIDKWLLHL